MTSSVIRTENEGLPIGTFVRFRENSNDEWRAGEILEGGEQTDREIITYKVFASWHNVGTGLIAVNHSDSLLQRVRVSEHEDLICSEFDRFVANCDVQVPPVCFRLRGRDPDDGPFGDRVSIGYCDCIYRHTEKMVIRFGASLRQHCKVLKRCTLHCHSRFGLRAIESLVGDIASASNPNVTDLHLNDIEPVLVDWIFKELLSKKKNSLRKLSFGHTSLLSLRFLEGLAGSLHTLSFSSVQLNDKSLEDLDEFFGMQTVMEQAVLQRLELKAYVSEQVAPFQQILHSLRKNDFLKALYLQTDFDIQLPRVVSLNIKLFLQKTEVLEELRLDGLPSGDDTDPDNIRRPLDDEDLDTVLEGVCTCSSLKELTINADSRDEVQKIVTALETHAADKHQGVRLLRLVSLSPDHTFLKKTKDFRFLLKQLDRLPALRHVDLQGGDVPLGCFLNEGCDKIVLDFLEHSHPLEVFKWYNWGWVFERKPAVDLFEASVDALCRVNWVFNRCVQKEIPPRLWSTLLASVSLEANTLFMLLLAYPGLADGKELSSVKVKRKKSTTPRSGLISVLSGLR